MNQLYYGDNLDVLRRHIEDESVDLVYLDPPFNSNASYNVLFAERDGTQAASQIKAFEDTWKWDEEAARTFEDVVETGGKTSQAMQAFRTSLGESDMMAYLAMMAPRLVALKRVMKPTGSIYLHCDPTASHYLKMLMDAIFSPQRFLNEIVWKRTHAHGSPKRFGPVHDVILFYGKTDEYVWMSPKVDQADGYLQDHFTHSEADSGRTFQPITLTGSGVRHGESGLPWRGVNPTKVGRHWALPGAVVAALGITGKTVQDRLDALDAAGRVYWPDKEGGTPRLKWYAEEATGKSIPDVWTDIPPISAQAKERLGYPTQKPEDLMDRIIQSSTREGDTVLDPFCGCGTTIASAQRLNRRWIGIDITHLAITLIRGRLTDTFQGAAKYEVIGEPVSLPDAAKLAADDPYQFQWWALGLVGARPVEQKKGADKGIDGRIYFHVGDTKTHQIILSVKAGHVTVSQVRDLRGVLDREGADMGVLISLEEATGPMRKEAASAGFYTSPWGKHPRLQLVTVEDLLTGKTIDRPPIQTSTTFKKAPKAPMKVRERQLRLDAPDPDQPF